METVLTERLELRKGKHLYVIDPEGFYKGTDNIFPVFKVDDRVVKVDEELANAYEGCTYLICDCDDYKERQRRFSDEKTYRRWRERWDFGWDCVATCRHIILMRRYFSKYLMEKVLEKIVETRESPAKVLADFSGSREANIFVKEAFAVAAEFSKKHGI